MLSPWVQFVPIKLALRAVELSHKTIPYCEGMGYFRKSVIFNRGAVVIQHEKNARCCCRGMLKSVLFLIGKLKYQLLLVPAVRVFLTPSGNSVVFQINWQVVFTFLNKSLRLVEIPEIPIIQYLLHLHSLFFL